MFEKLAVLGDKTSTVLSDAMPCAVQEQECAKCIKSIMNHKSGMEFVIGSEKQFVCKLIEGKATRTAMIQISVSV